MADVEVRIDTQVISKKGSFKYLEFVIQGIKEIDDDVTYRVGADEMEARI